jgi:hypothetical protein
MSVAAVMWKDKDQILGFSGTKSNLSLTNMTIAHIMSKKFTAKNFEE